ncbi:uncharacterized protein RSE6_12022 [Rhynchosporium secalis]|uniref:N-acetyltransferase domain-containing protein n=1 Tax=Rhynchosporium secalis TaxID=38038 RepID=A0A1E1MPC2_RHYSE|nr:uncharacterized protein RSE6_12022 [Rhynchosporium secalis]
MGNSNPISISICPATPLDLPILSRLDIAANSSHPLISQSFQYPFQALKLWLAHLQFCYERPKEYRILVAKLSSGKSKREQDLKVEIEVEVAEGEKLELERSASIDSGVDVSLGSLVSKCGSEEDTEEQKDDGEGEIVGFMMWRVCKSQEEREESVGKDDEWNWISQLPKGTDLKQWKRYVEVMSSESGIGDGDVEILKLAVLPRYQGRGIGTRLLQFFFSNLSPPFSSALDKPTLSHPTKIRVRASRSAKTLYEKFGWTIAKEYTLDLRAGGRGRAYVDFEMLRVV